MASIIYLLLVLFGAGFIGAVPQEMLEYNKILSGPGQANIESVIEAAKEAIRTEFDIRLSTLEGKVATMEKLLIKEENVDVKKVEDPIEDRVSKLEDLAKVGTLRSCAEYSQFGLTSSGYYTIDPDGSLLGHQPFQVYCNFIDMATEIRHDSEHILDIENCHDPGCFSKSISYIDGKTEEPVEMSQILSLIQLSESCEQDIRYDCTLAPLNDNNVDYAFWYDRDGQTNTYFTGSNYGYHVCDCHYEAEGCIDAKTKTNRCNCDANIPVPMSDSGTIRNITALPLTKLFFGGLSYSIQNAKFTLGRLKCFGQSAVEDGTSCEALKKAGTLQSGYYNIKDKDDLHAKLVYCDMTTEAYSEVPQIDVVPDSSPLGTIIAWVPKPDSDSTNSPLPDGWVACDGSTIAKGEWKGRKTPDLNNGGHFLRGGKDEEILDFQEDQLQEHIHQDPGHSHSATSTSSPHTHTFEDGHISTDGGGYYDSKWQDGHSDGGFMRRLETTNSGTVSVSTSISSDNSAIGGVTSSYRKGTETRPKNMAITWVMRCW